MSIRVTPRALTPDEARVLEAILSLDFAGAANLRAQVPHTQVVGRCDCGCATVDLAVDSDLAPAAEGGGRPIRAEATLVDGSGEPIAGVIVFLRDGYLSTLEVYGFGNAPVVREWPAADRLRLDLREE